LESELKTKLDFVEEHLEFIKKQKQSLESELKTIREKDESAKICLSNVKSKEEARQLLQIYKNSEIYVRPYSSISLEEYINHAIKTEKVVDSNCVVYYNIEQKYKLKVIPYDCDSKWLKAWKWLDESTNWIRVYAK
jgi:septation ring formation regulator EzrA